MYQNFIYEPKEINKKVELNPIQFFKDESSYVIYEGYHSYKDMPYSGPYYRTIYLGKIAEDYIIFILLQHLLYLKVLNITRMVEEK